jgi:hypothetical protein
MLMELTEKFYWSLSEKVRLIGVEVAAALQMPMLQFLSDVVIWKAIPEEAGEDFDWNGSLVSGLQAVVDAAAENEALSAALTAVPGLQALLDGEGYKTPQPASEEPAEDVGLDSEAAS